MLIITNRLLVHMVYILVVLSALIHIVTFTSMMVPFVMTPKLVYMVDVGFFFTQMMGKQNVALSSGCVTCALLNRRP